MEMSNDWFVDYIVYFAGCKNQPERRWVTMPDLSLQSACLMCWIPLRMSGPRGSLQLTYLISLCLRCWILLSYIPLHDVLNSFYDVWPNMCIAVCCKRMFHQPGGDTVACGHHGIGRKRTLLKTWMGKLLFKSCTHHKGMPFPVPNVVRYSLSACQAQWLEWPTWGALSPQNVNGFQQFIVNHRWYDNLSKIHERRLVLWNVAFMDVMSLPYLP